MLYIRKKYNSDLANWVRKEFALLVVTINIESLCSGNSTNRTIMNNHE